MSVTETFPSYFMGKNPERRVIEASYGDILAQRFGKLNRQKVSEFGEELFNIRLSKEKSSMTEWDIEGHAGGMLSVGIGASLSGFGCECLIIDDPVKNAEEAASETYRNKVWNEWQMTLSTRLHPEARVIVILTRWNEDDLAGRLLADNSDEWDIVSLPAVAEENDLLGRELDEPLWPEHGYDAKWAEAQKNRSGSQAWASLYQQHPSPLEGGLVKRFWWQYYRQMPELSNFQEMIQSWDCAFKDEKASKSGAPDYVVGQVWGRIKANKYLLDQVRDRMSFPETIQAIRSLSAKWPMARAKLVEDKANGPAVISTLRNEISGLIPVNPQGGKIVRIQAVSPDIEAGNVYLPDPSIAPWIHDYVEELSAFPNGANDDMVDSTSQALFRLGSMKSMLIRPSDHVAKQEPIQAAGETILQGVPFAVESGTMLPVPRIKARKDGRYECPECGEVCMAMRNPMDFSTGKTKKMGQCKVHGWLEIIEG